ncbi:MAG: pullulanase, partial [Candidatus Marinimicrobia bacterium]|nr:pullulanase [Candidatus Neomarinimicrobiota bacterium]
MPYRLPYGAFFNGQQTEFKLYAPTSDKVFLVLFDTFDAQTGKEIPMENDNAGNWTLTLKDAGIGTLYGYRLEGPQNDPNVIVADPWTQAAVTQNTYRHVAKSLIVDHRYDWEGDQWQQINPRDLIIYEMHVRDMTVHPTSECPQPGTYIGLVNSNQQSGITHLKNMGINAVQILPAQDFANVEIPYKDKSSPVYNSWNPYARNHWGYMTTFFFAPETYYATDGSMQPDVWNGTDGRAVNEFKDMVKSFHTADVAVIMDVVYNHISNYDWHPFKYIDKESYFR